MVQNFHICLWSGPRGEINNKLENENKEIGRDLAVATQRIFSKRELKQRMYDVWQSAEVWDKDKSRGAEDNERLRWVEVGSYRGSLVTDYQTKFIYDKNSDKYLFGFSPENSFKGIVWFYSLFSHRGLLLHQIQYCFFYAIYSSNSSINCKQRREIPQQDRKKWNFIFNSLNWLNLSIWFWRHLLHPRLSS